MLYTGSTKIGDLTLVRVTMKLPFEADVWIARNSSPVDWCEENYVVTSYIAEFVNTVSNILFLTIPLMSFRLWSSYACCITKQIYVTLLLFFIIGLSSVYFHATLSFLGQILDELSILWLLVHVNYHFIPRHYWMKILQPHPKVYKGIIAIIGVFSTVCAFIRPEMNQYGLLTLGIPLTYLFITELTRTNETRIKYLGIITVISLCLAVTAWVSDKILCSFWRKMNFTIFHGLWHVVIVISTYLAETIACYNYAKYDVPGSKPVIRFWPGSNWGFLPYVSCTKKMLKDR